MTFEEAQSLFGADRIQTLASTADGLRYLKLRSLNRKANLEKLFAAARITPKSPKARDLFREAFETPKINTQLIERLMREISEADRSLRRPQEEKLVSHLYRMRSFDWGGLHQNSLEKTIVDNYVKKITDFDKLEASIENELHNSLRGYVHCSWYNHWTSIIIEDVFRDHSKVLPAVGRVKKIDFFVNDTPFDLKVTYLPEGYIQENRKKDGLRPELTLLKKSARSLQIHFDKDLSNARLLEDLWDKHRDHPSEDAQEILRKLEEYRLNLLSKAQDDSSKLIRWLYENQGIRRFDASNRLYLVLVDRSCFFDSWKLKRAKPLLDSHITSYLDDCSDRPGKEIEFSWEGKTYSAVSDVVFVVHP